MSNRRTVAAVTCALLCSMITLVSCGTSGGATDGSSDALTAAKAACPIKILLITSLTGFNSESGISAKVGEQVAVKDINNSGGLLGCHVALTTEDDASDTTQDPTLAEKALASNQYSQIFAYGYGAQEVQTLVNKDNKLFISGFGTDSLNNPSQYPLFFDSNIDLIPTTTQVADLMKSKGYHHIALVTDQSLYGQTNETALTKALPKSDIAGSVTVADDVVDATPIALQVKAMNPDAIFVDLFGTALGHVLTAFSQNGLNVPLFGSQSADVTDITTLVSSPAIYHGMVVAGTNTMTIGAPNPGLNPFIHATVAASGGHLQGGMASYVLEASATAIWAAAVKATQSLTNAQKQKAWLQSHGKTPIPGNLMTPNNTTGYSSTNHAMSGAGSISFSVMGPFVNGQRKAYHP